jgi:hypothetical protein
MVGYIYFFSSGFESISLVEIQKEIIVVHLTVVDITMSHKIMWSVFIWLLS